MRLFVLGLCLLGLSCTPDRDRADAGSSNNTSATRDTGTASALARAPLSRPQPSKPVEEMSKSEREVFIAQLQKSGFYSCCIDRGCSTCLLNEVDCPCEQAVKQNDPVCGECYRGWQKGKGKVSGINAAQVRRR